MYTSGFFYLVHASNKKVSLVVENIGYLEVYMDVHLANACKEHVTSK